MKRISIGILKARLSEYLDAVRAGEEVIVTDRGKPVARLLPVGGSDQAKSRMVELVRAGLARPPRERLGKDFWKLPRPKDPEGKVLAALLEERAESR
jgi:prevent-host-death family protein